MLGRNSALSAFYVSYLRLSGENTENVLEAMIRTRSGLQCITEIVTCCLRPRTYVGLFTDMAAAFLLGDIPLLGSHSRLLYWQVLLLPLGQGGCLFSRFPKPCTRKAKINWARKQLGRILKEEEISC